MQQLRKALAVFSVALITLASFTIQAQQPRFLSLTPPEGLPIIPVMEGWVANPDGSRSISFGYINRNDVAVDLPLGEANNIDPPEFGGMQPTHFPSGRGTGVFTVDVPADKAAIDVWWSLKTGSQEPLRVPGRSGRTAYELDFILPRPQGAMQVHAGFGENDPISPGLMASIRDYAGSVKVGEEVLLSVKVKDISVRDLNDTRFKEPLSVGVHFYQHQGAGEVTFTRHPDTSVPVNPYEPDDRRFAFFREPEANDVEIPGVEGVFTTEGVARVFAKFAQPGEYIIRAKAENFDSPDSSDGDQCCWTNVFQRITVTP
ncbi:MAG: hypothetical protein EXR84_11570 [Gammaproteobacteria bacterium]|nr:hypothetical protein [Gammaproteobacteria bacterium]